MSRSLLRSVLELRTPITRLPPSYLLPIRATATPSPATSAARFASSTTATTTTTDTTQNTINPATPPTATPTHSTSPPSAPTATTSSTPSSILDKSSPSPSPTASVAELLPLLRAQPRHYMTIHIHQQRYLVTEGDSIRLPFKMSDVLPGDVLRLDRASILGSRDYTLKGSPFIEPSLYECRATVLGTETEPLRTMIKTKRRNRRNTHVKSKHKYTVLRISEIKVL